MSPRPSSGKSAQLSQSGVTRIAAVQMASGPNVEANLQEAGRLIEMAVDKGARLVALPEYFAIMGMRRHRQGGGAREGGRGPDPGFSLADREEARDLARRRLRSRSNASRPGKVRNSCLVYDDKGRLAARYDKIHLFGFEMGQESYAEERTIEPGRAVVTVDSPFGRIGALDLLRPALSRALPRDEGRGHHPRARRRSPRPRARRIGKR